MTQEKRPYTKRSPGKRARTKGNSFENEVAKLLTKWSGSKFRRVPLSGGWQSSKVATGDLFLVAEYETARTGDGLRVRFPFSVECKKQEGWDFAQLFRDSEKCPLRLWWEQASNDAKIIKKLPALIFARNYSPIFIMVSTLTANRLVRLTEGTWRDLTHVMSPMAKKEQAVIFLLEDFFSWVPFRTLLELTI